MNKANLFAFCLWGLSLFVPIVSANKLSFKSLELKDGLPYNAVRSITSDDKGYIWIGTELGLARFDGYSISSFLSNPQQQKSLPSNYIKQLVLDSGGKLWISTSKGLSRYHLAANHFLNWKEESRSSISELSELSDNIKSLAEDDEGIFWIATDKGLNSLNPKNNRLEHFSIPQIENSGIRIKSIRALLPQKGQIYIGATEGLFVRHADNKYYPIKIKEGEQPIVRSLVSTSSGEIWIGTHEGLFIYQPKTETIRKLALNGRVKYVLSMLQDYQDNVWVGTFDWGLFRVDQNGNVLNFQPDKGDATSISGKTILSLHQDPSGMIWAGTYNHGVSYFDPHQLTLGAYDNSLNSLPCMPSSDVRSAQMIDNDKVLLGTLKGATLLNLTSKQCSVLQHSNTDDKTISDNEVFAIELLDTDTVWIGTGQGLDKLSIDSGSVERFGSKIEDALVFDIFRDRESLFLATSRGIYHFDTNSEIATKLISPNTNNLVASVFADTINGLLFVGTNHGIFQINRELKKLEAIEFPSNLSSSKVVYGLSSSKDSGLYFTIEGQGLFNWNPNTNQITELTRSWNISVIEGFTGIYTTDDNKIWITTVQKGLFHRDLNTNTTTNYRTSDGLVSDVLNLNAVTTFPDGRWLFGNREGFNLFEPKLITTNLNPPIVSLADMTIYGNQVRYEKSKSEFSLTNHISEIEELNLSYQEAVFGFNILATHYAEPSKLEYKYRLKGLNPDWIKLTSQQRSVAFSNLQPGDYQFQLKAVTSKGVENKLPLELSIFVATPPWKTWWAYTLYIFLLLAIIISIYWIRTRTLREQAILLQKKVNNRTEQLKKEKEKIESLLSIKNDELANVSHEFRTPLTLILGPLDQVIESLKNATAISRLKVVQRNGFRLLRMVDQLLNLETFRVKTITQKSPQPISQIIDQLGTAFSDLAKEKGIVLTYENNTFLNFEFTPDAFEKIILNLLSNAIKYTSAGGKIRFSAIRSSDDELVIQVVDTGLGIPEDQLISIFDRYSRVLETQTEQINGSGIGLALVKSLIEAHQGRIEVKSELGQGSCFTVYLPIIDETDSLEVFSYSNKEILELEMKSLDVDSDNLTSLQRESSIDHLSSDGSAEMSVGEQTTITPSILIVEDNHDMQRYLLEILGSYYTCEIASNGKQGFKKAKELVPDIILSDVMMPKMDGYKLAESLRSEMLTCHIPIVFLTAKGDKESRLEGWRRDIDEYLTKPFDPKELTLRLKNILSIRQILADKLKNKQIGLLANSKTNELSVPDKRFLDKLSSYIESNYADPNLGLANVARGVAISERQLQRKLKAVLNKGLTEYIRDYRLAKSKDLLKQGISVIDVSMLCGFSSQSYFSSCFKALYEITPKKYQQSSR